MLQAPSNMILGLSHDDYKVAVSITHLCAFPYPTKRCHWQSTDNIGATRKCNLRTCKNILPSVDKYKWKMCISCRLCLRFTAKRRQVISLINRVSEVDSRGGLARHIINDYQRQLRKRRYHSLVDDDNRLVRYICMVRQTFRLLILITTIQEKADESPSDQQAGNEKIQPDSADDIPEKPGRGLPMV